MAEEPRLTTSAATYARRIERRLSEILERPLVLSPRDWTLLGRWHDRGIPLGIVEEAIGAAAERARTRGQAGRRVGLSQIARAVEEAWQSVVDGRVADPAREIAPRPERSAPQAWRARIAAEAARSALARLLTELLARLESGAAPAELDSELDRRLPDVVDPDLLARVDADLDRDLAPHRRKIPQDALALARSRARPHRLRARLGLPRLERDGS